MEEDFTPLLGKVTSEKMGLITVHYENFESVSEIAVDADLLSSHNDVFDDDQGSLPWAAHFVVDETATPVISSAARIPHGMKLTVKSELEKLTEQRITAPEEEPTSWCSRMVVATKKSGKLRICIDPRHLNEVLHREHCPLPVMEDMLPKLSNERVFSN